MSDRDAIFEALERWKRAALAGDLASLLALLADDVVFLTPGRAPFGKARFAADSSGRSGRLTELDIECLELEVAGDWAYMRNDLRLVFDGATLAGQTLSIFRRGGDGGWRIARDANFVVPLADSEPNP